MHLRNDESINIFDYDSYRTYLSDFYNQQKTNKTGFTYANFAKKVGLKSPNYYKLVMDGEKNLTPENTVRFANGLELKELEVDFFETLVNFNQAKLDLEKKFYKKRLDKILQDNNKQNNIVVADEDFGNISHWLFHAIYVLSRTEAWTSDPAKLKDLLFGMASQEEISHAIDILSDMGFISSEHSNLPLRQYGVCG